MSASIATRFLRRSYLNTTCVKSCLKSTKCLHTARVRGYVNNSFCGQELNGTIPIYQSRKTIPGQLRCGFVTSCRCLGAEGATEVKGDDQEEEYHSIIKDTERARGPADKHEFQAETRKLLDIVARSLYSEKEVFIRELISNASDALEKLRYIQMSQEDIVDEHVPLEIHIATDDSKKTFTIQDTGVGMLKEEMIDNLGTIARSGSRAFLESLKGKPSTDINSNIIGQFGVGFYSSFMVADKVTVFSKSYKPDSTAYKWTSDGQETQKERETNPPQKYTKPLSCKLGERHSGRTGTYDITEAEGVQRGTKIVVHLKGDCYNFAKEEIIKEVVKKYSNFVGVPIYLNGKRANIILPLWLMDPKDITDEMHEEFYRFVANVFDKPRYHLHYKTDAPLNIRALFYIPEYKPTMFDMSRETDVSVNLYSKKVMIMAKANTILPKWLRFMKGVVDSEDIPLNLSRELLQDSALIRKLNSVLTKRILKFLLDQARKDKEKYLKFYEDYGLFFREGIVTQPDQETREEIAKLLRFESSHCPKGDSVGLEDYAKRMRAGSRNIYYLSVPSRELAENSPYLEALKKKEVEVLFLYEPYDELVLMNLGQFDKKFLKSIENEMTDDKEDTNTVDEKDPVSLKQAEADNLMSWLKGVLGNKVQKIKVTKKLVSHPSVVTVLEMGSARHFLKTTLLDKSQDEKFRLLQPTLEINPSHPLIKKLHRLQTEDPVLGKLLAEQLYDNAMINAGLMDDTRSMVNRLNQLLEKALDKN